jgi:hypothetical protein
MFELKVDIISFLSAGFVGILFHFMNYFEVVDRFFLRWVIRLCVQVPKTSKFKELKNKPLKSIVQQFPTDTEQLKGILQKINKDPNLKYSGVNKDISLIIACLYDDKDELLVDTMDNLVISKLGVEILIFKFEKNVSDELYDRSIFIDITSYRGTIFQLRSFFTAACSFFTFLLSSSDYLRNLFK